MLVSAVTAKYTSHLDVIWTYMVLKHPFLRKDSRIIALYCKYLVFIKIEIFLDTPMKLCVMNNSYKS